MTNKLHRTLIVATLALTLVACGQGLTTQQGSVQKSTGTDGGGAGGGYAPIPFDYQSLEKQSLLDAAEAEITAQKAAAEAEKALNKISLGSGGLSFGGSNGADQQIIVDKMVGKLLNKVIAELKTAPEKFNLIRGKLAEAMARLDPNNPLHQRAIDALMLVMGKLDLLEEKFKDLLVVVADNVDIVSDRLSSLASGIPFPASLLVQVELGDVKRVLRNFQTQLRNL